MTRKQLLEKIKKLIALSNSSNPHEAAAALLRAQKLMENTILKKNLYQMVTAISAILN